MKKITLWLFALFTCWQISAQTGTVIVGVNDGTPNTATGNPSPLQDYYKTQRMQVLYTASELSAAGLVAGNITEIGWVATALNTSTLQENYTISMKSTASTALTATFESGATVVYGPADFTPSATGNVMFTLTTPFVWDGTSNVIIELCAGLASGGYTENVSCANSTTSDVKTVYYIDDYAISPCTQATGTTTTTRPVLVTVGNVASCLAPLNLVSANINPFTADVSWDASTSGSAVGYEYVVSTSNIAPVGAGTALTNSYVSLSALLPQTTYYLFVRTYCGGATFSGWNGPTAFTTACAPISNFSENFDTVTTPALPTCWSKILSGGTISTFASVNTVNFVSASAPNGVTLYNSDSEATDNIMLVTPMLTNISAGTHRLKFKARNNTDSQDLEIGVLTNPTDASTFTLVQAVDITTTFQSYVVNFDTFTGSGAVIALRRLSTSTYTDVYLDDIVWEAMPSCPDQTGLTVSAITSTGADTSWDAVAAGVEYAITTSATPPATGTPTTSTFYIATGLSPQTVYYLHVRTDCGAGSYGIWATTTFTTACVPVVALPWNEGFETVAVGTNIFPQCWGYSNTLSVWDIETFPVANSGVNSLGRTWSTDGWAYTPMFTLTAGISYRFSYYVRTQDATVGYDVTVGVGNSQNSAAMTTTLSTVTGYQGPAWVKVNHEFTPLTNGDYSFGVHVVAPVAPNGINFDDFKLELSPTCPDQTGLTVSGITSTGANTSWDAVAAGVEYAITTSATPPATGTPTTSTFYIATGLSPQTVYYLHVRTDCGAGSYGIWVSIPFTTSCVPVVALPWTEGFEGLATGDNIFPTCWGYSNTSSVWNIETTPVANTGVNSLGRTWSTNGWAFTPMFTLAAGTSYTFSYYMRTVDTVVGYDVTVGVGIGQNSAAMTTTLGTPLTSFQNPTWTIYNFEFTPGTTGDYAFGVHAVAPTFAPNGINFDDFRVQLSALGSNSFDKSAFVAYPNPVKDILNLSYSSVISNVKVVNLLGQEVLNAKTNTNDVKVNMSALSAGAYIVNITVEDTVHTIKVIKE